VLNSGKLLILGIVALAVLLAGASWWFRYNATHRAAQFWGPQGARLVRDATSVYLIKLPASESFGSIRNTASGYDISKVRGLTHLRNALLEDRSFDWTSASGNPKTNCDFIGKWELEFRDADSAEPFTIRLTADCGRAAAMDEDDCPRGVISTAPVAVGLRQVLDEYWSAAATPTH
jgi:hypothetical protein